MQRQAVFRWVALLVVYSLLLTACQRSSSEVWDDTRTAGRHVENGFRTLIGQKSSSPQVRDRAEFVPVKRRPSQDFIALQDDDLAGELSLTDMELWEQPASSPGDPDSLIPGIDSFASVDGDERLAAVFRIIHFPYNSDLIKGADRHQTLEEMANYLKKHPDAYVFVEGHCDERGTAAYNLALGARRSNSVRNMLVRFGADLDRVFTVSYGKERPRVEGHDEVSWQENRRAEFRVYHRT